MSFSAVRLSLALFAAALLLAAPARADAIVRTQAMLASTIAEIYVEDGGIRVELEIGLVDLPAFRNLLPDEIYERLGEEPRPMVERFVEFTTRDLVFVADDGPPLVGGIVEMLPRDRVRRDPITGEPLPQDEQEPEGTVFVRLEYPLERRPQTLTLGGTLPGSAAVGYVVYHGGIAVNDFRYLMPSQTLQLDWEDPWYSQFGVRSLRRSYFAPMSGFLYVEHLEVRKEIILRPKDLQRWIDLGLEGRRVIPVEMQDGLKRTVAAFLQEHQPVTIDGEPAAAELAQINFLERTLKSSRVIDPPVELDIDSAILGAIFVYPIDGLPQRVTMEWDLFDERIRVVPGAAVDQAGPLPTMLEPDFAVLEWQNFLKNPELPTLVALPSPPTAAERVAAWLRWVGLVGGLLIAGALVRGRLRQDGGSARRAAALGVVAALTVACFWFGSRAAPDDERVGEVVQGLLHNVYRAFDFRDEERIYDVLAGSVDAELLTRIYLETRRGLELANQGGARAKVKEIELVEVTADAGDGGGFVATTTWNVAGSVGHWGHIHQRRNRYRARLDVRPIDGRWKLAGLDILDEERL